MALLMLAAAFAGCTYWRLEKGEYTGALKTFGSYDELTKFIKSGQEYAGGTAGPGSWGGIFDSANEKGTAPALTGGSGAPEHSQTNIQVAGVDEADIVKNDGQYIYKVVNAGYYGVWREGGENGKELQNKVVIIRANDGKMDVVSEISVPFEISGIFIDYENSERLVIIGNTWSYNGAPGVREGGGMKGEGSSASYEGPQNNVYIYDISDKANPSELYKFNISGSYSTSRMIGGWVYVVSNQWTYWYDNETVPLPAIEKNGERKEIDAEEIQYIDCPQPSYSYTIISAINITTGEDNEKAFLLGDSSTIYVSESHLYLTTTNHWRYWIWTRDKSTDINRQETTVHKFAIKGASIAHTAEGKVIGHVLNQFSMDEFNDYFRIATTKEREWWVDRSMMSDMSNTAESENYVYVLDADMKAVGKTEALAKGERIYSARFMGDKLYLVTFRQVDPLFVIDLSEPTNPQVLGFVKITGASEYLHPYDENHIIGVGFEATEQGQRTGLKVSMFDVSDFANPKPMSDYVIKGAWSESSWDHHAFLFSKPKNLMVIPVEVYGWDLENPSEHFSGAYIFNVTLEKGIALYGKISHQPLPESKTYTYTYENSGQYVSMPPGSYVNITLECDLTKEWNLYSKGALTLQDKGTEIKGTNKVFWYLFKASGEGSASIMAKEELLGTDVNTGRYFDLGISSYYQVDRERRITRSLYIENVLYTNSDMMLKSNNLIKNLAEIDLIDFEGSR